MRRYPPTTWRDRNGSTRAWRNTRNLILNRDGHTCQLCGNHATHCDHITPGAGDHPANLQALCATCNQSKG